MKVYIVRHGQTDVNLAGLINARNDEDLNETGELQAVEMGRRLEKENYDLIISSPLRRTVHTACLLNRKNVPILTDEALLERDFGIYTKTPVTGLDRDDLWRLDPEKDYADAETVRSMVERVFSFMDALKERQAGKNVVLVTHGGVSKALRAYCEGMPADGNLAKYKHPNGEIFLYEL